MLDRSFVGAIVGALALAVLMPGEARGQQRWVFEGRGGVGIPAGELADVADVGPAFGAKIGYELHPRVTLRAAGDVEFLPGADLANGTEAPDLRLWHYNGGVDVQLAPPTSRWSLIVTGAGGATTIDSDSFGGVSGGNDFSHTYFTLNGGAQVGYAVSPRVNVFAGGLAYVTFADEEDTVAFATLSPEVDAFDTALSIPLFAGITLRTP